MADIDIDPLGNMIRQTHILMKVNPRGGAMGGSTWEPECKQETSFGGMSLMMKVLREHVNELY